MTNNLINLNRCLLHETRCSHQGCQVHNFDLGSDVIDKSAISRRRKISSSNYRQRRWLNYGRDRRDTWASTWVVPHRRGGACLLHCAINSYTLDSRIRYYQLSRRFVLITHDAISKVRQNFFTRVPYHVSMNRNADTFLFKHLYHEFIPTFIKTWCQTYTVIYFNYNANREFLH